MGILTVTSLTDEVNGEDGALTLREAIALANQLPDQDTIAFASGLAGTLSLAAGELLITRDLVIDGAGRITIDAHQASRVVAVDGTGTDVEVRGLILTGGAAFRGGGVLAATGTTVGFFDSSIRSNHATYGGGVSGDVVTLENSTVVDNAADLDTGGIEGQQIFLVNSTVTGNWAQRYAGGVSAQTAASVHMTDSILLGNSADLYDEYFFKSLTTTGTNIVGIDGGNGNALVYLPDASTVATSIADVFAATEQRVNPDREVFAAGVADASGHVALKADSANPALDASTGPAPTATDARGQPAVDIPDVGHDGSTASVRDLGAVELAVALLAEPIADQVVAEDTAWSFTLPDDTFDIDGPVSLSLTSAPPWVSFDPQTRILSGTPPLDINGFFEITITALGQGDLSASDTFRLTVTPVNDAPSVGTDAVAAVEGETPDGNVLDNDSDADLDMLTVTGVAGARGPGVVGQELVGKYGALTLEADGHYTYAASNSPLPEGETASETFTYTVGDGHGGIATAEIVVSVTGGNPPFGGNGGTRQGAIGAGGVIVAVGDFDGDGRTDFLWRSGTDGTVEARLADARSGGFSAKTLGPVPTDHSFAAVGDVDGDGRDDVVIRDDASGATGAWIMRNGAPADWRPLGTVSNDWTIVGAGDFDRDGRDDVLLFNAAAGAVDLIAQGKTGPDERTTIATIEAGWTIVGIGDLDGNGTDDVLVFNAADRHLGAWQMSAGKPGGWSDFGTLKEGWAVTAIGNFNGTGPEDIGFYQADTGRDGAWSMFAGHISDWIDAGAHDALDAIGAGRLGGATDQILWHNPATGALVTF